MRLWAHCVRPTCPGSGEVEVDGLREETGFMFTDNGGDIPGIERSNVQYQFENPDELACPSCGKGRELSQDRRPSYDPLSGHDPMGLLQAERFDPSVRNGPDDARVAELEAKLVRAMDTLESQSERINALVEVAEMDAKKLDTIVLEDE